MLSGEKFATEIPIGNAKILMRHTHPKQVNTKTAIRSSLQLRSQPIAAQPAPFDQFKEFNSQLLDTFDLATVLARI